MPLTPQQNKHKNKFKLVRIYLIEIVLKDAFKTIQDGKKYGMDKEEYLNHKIWLNFYDQLLDLIKILERREK